MDSVKFKAQERLDLVDANALQSLVYEYMSEALGGLMGNSGGALTMLQYTTASGGGVYTLELKAFQYYHCQPGPTVAVTEPDGTVRNVPRRYTGQVITFDPADEGQSATVDWSATRLTWETSAVPANQTGLTAKQAVHGGHKPGGALLMPYLWARPYSADTDTDSRREWSVAAQAEVAVSIPTRTRTLTAFKFQSARPAVSPSDPNQNQWVAVGRCVAWDYTSGTVNAAGANIPDAPYIAPIYVWDQSFSYGDYEQANGLESAAMSGRVGHGTARFAMDDGSPGAGSHPGENVNGQTNLETTPFEHDGATVSHFGRGKWVPGSKTGEPTITGGAADIVGAAAAGAQPWPYPGWYDDRTSAWKSLVDSGFQTDQPLWRLGIPHVMHLMRRQMASIMSSKGDRPWYAHPAEGGLVELRDEIDSLRTYVDSSVTGLDYVTDESGGSLSVLAAGRLDDTGVTPAWTGQGITFVERLITTAGETTADKSSNGATGYVFRCDGATVLRGIASVLVTCDAYGVGSDLDPREPSAGDATLPQGLRNRLSQAWVTLGDAAKANTSTHFTVWVSAHLLGSKSGAVGPVQLRVGVNCDPGGLGPENNRVRIWEASELAPSLSFASPGEAVAGPTNFHVDIDYSEAWSSVNAISSFNVLVIGGPAGLAPAPL